MFDYFTDFVRGATMMAEAGISLFFFKYSKETDDRLFLYFALGFCIMAISQFVVCIGSDSGDFAPLGYGIRASAFVLLLLGIVEKNLPKKKNSGTDTRDD